MRDNSKSNMIPVSILEDIKQQLDKHFKTEIAIPTDNKEIAGWFMGTRGENLNVVSEIILSTLNSVVGDRELLFPDDPNYITPDIKLSEGYKSGIQSVKKHTDDLLAILNKYSLPTQSLRYQGHMLWDITLPSLIGYFAGMLQNQNNVTPQASPATTLIELLASNDIAEMAGFNVKRLEVNEQANTPTKKAKSSNDITAWAHITSGGNVANIESLWAARELKFLPLGIQDALNNEEDYENIDLRLPDGDKYPLDGKLWELLNLKQDDILKLPYQICDLLYPNLDDEKKNEKLGDIWTNLTSKYSTNAKGISYFMSKLEKADIKAPCVIAPSTRHYSWPKGASILGMGNGQKGLKEEELTEIDNIKDHGLINIYVDDEGQVKHKLLKAVLETCKSNQKPVIMVVGVIGTTEEGAVDPLDKILEIRNDFRKNADLHFEFSIHADAAWGGYFLSCIREPFDMNAGELLLKNANPMSNDVFSNRQTWLRDEVYESMSRICECDSATIDPHKMGYIPYPAGSLIYRNDKIINLLTFSAPYIGSGKDDNIDTRNIGQSGIEGSKSGAATTSVYLSHKVIRPDKTGYGKIINQSMLNSKIFYIYLAHIKEFAKKGVFKNQKSEIMKPNFDIVMFNAPRLTAAERLSAVENADKFRPEKLHGSSNTFLMIHDILRKVAGDQNIVDYIFVDPYNKTPEQTIELNESIFNALDLKPNSKVKPDDIFVSMTTFHKEEYGETFMKALAKRIYNCKESEITDEMMTKIPCIRSVIMDPWAIYTHKEKQHDFFRDTFIPRLIEVANNELRKLKTKFLNEKPIKLFQR